MSLKYGKAMRCTGRRYRALNTVDRTATALESLHPDGRPQSQTLPDGINTRSSLSRVGAYTTLNTNHKTRNSKLESRNTKLETRITKHETRNTKHETPKLATQPVSPG